MEEVDVAPLEALGRVDGGQREPVVVEVRGPGPLAGDAGRVEGELDEHAAAGVVPLGGRGDRVEIGQPGRRVVVLAGEEQFAETPESVDLGGGGEDAVLLAVAQAVTEGGSEFVDLCSCGRPHPSGTVEERAQRILASPRCPSSSDRRRSVAGPTPSSPARTRCHASWSAGLSSTRNNARRSLTWAASRCLRPPYFSKGMSRRVSSSSRPVGVVTGAEQHGLVAQVDAPLPGVEDPIGHPCALGGLVVAGHDPRRVPCASRLHSSLARCGFLPAIGWPSTALADRRIGMVER